MSMVIRTTAIAALIALASSSAAFAQAERPQRLFRGLFGGPAPSPDRQTSLDLDVSLSGAYDTDLAASQGASVTTQNPDSGAYSGLDLGLTFTHSRPHVDFAASAGSNAQYYPTLHRTTSVGDQASISVDVHANRASVTVMESGSYSPLFMLAPFVAPAAASAADVGPSSLNTALLRETMFGSSTGLTGELKLGPRWSLDSNGAVTTSSVRYAAGSVKQQGWTAGARLHRQISAAAGFHVGYTEQVMTPLRGLPAFRVYNADVGMDYNKALGRTRKTTMSFSSGSALAQDGTRNLYTVLADASLNREMGRSWVAAANYHRGLGMVPGFSRPLFSDAVSGSLTGLITRRVDVSSDVAYTNGQLGITSLTNRLAGYNASTRVRYAITQLYAVYGEYSVYWYDLANNLYVAAPVPPNVLRQGVHVGLTLRLPLVR
jgi:hypothetical protein